MKRMTGKGTLDCREEERKTKKIKSPSVRMCVGGGVKRGMKNEANEVR